MSALKRWIGRRSVNGVAMLVLLTLIAAPATADLQRGNSEIGFDLGFTKLDFDDDDGAYRWGVRGGYLFNNVFELEGQIWTTEGDAGDFDVTFNTFFVNAVFNSHFRKKRNIVPYSLVGIGTLSAEIDGQGANVDDDSLAFQLAAGVRIFLKKRSRLALRLEVSFLFEETFDTRAEHLTFGAGLTWKIRGERR